MGGPRAPTEQPTLSAACKVYRVQCWQVFMAWDEEQDCHNRDSSKWTCKRVQDGPQRYEGLGGGSVRCVSAGQSAGKEATISESVDSVMTMLRIGLR